MKLGIAIVLSIVLMSAFMPMSMARERTDRPPKLTVSLNQCTEYRYYSDIFYNGSWINPAWHKLSVPCPGVPVR